MKQVLSPQQKKSTRSSTRGEHKAIVSPLVRSAKSSSVYTKKIKRYAKQGVKSLLMSPLFYTTCKATSVILVVVGILYSSYLFIGKTFANEVVVSQSEIIAKVGKLTDLPSESPDQVVRVQDPENLRKQNSFYKDIEEGDYILIYKNVAVIYDFRDNRIIAVKRTTQATSR